MKKYKISLAEGWWRDWLFVFFAAVIVFIALPYYLGFVRVMLAKNEVQVQKILSECQP